METLSVEYYYKEKLLGKKLKFLKSWKRLYEAKTIQVKKSHNVTDAQFAGGNPKFRMNSTKNVSLGYHAIYLIEEITSVRLVGGYESGDESSIEILTDGGHSFSIFIHHTVQEVDHGIFMLDS